MYARKFQVCLTDTPYYHVVSRCVRRAWLWGRDEYAGRDYTHRKAWVLARMSELTNLFAIDICAYAVMANHYHLVIRVNRSVAQAWDDEGSNRWMSRSCLGTFSWNCRDWAEWDGTSSCPN